MAGSHRAPLEVRPFPFHTTSQQARVATWLPILLIGLMALLAVWTSRTAGPTFFARYALLSGSIIALALVALAVARVGAHAASLRLLALGLLTVNIAAPHYLARGGAQLFLQIIPVATIAILLFAAMFFRLAFTVLLGGLSLANVVAVLMVWGTEGINGRIHLIALNYALVVGMVVLWAHVTRRLLEQAHVEARRALELRASTEELARSRRLLNRELEHRVKNNLQTILSIVHLQLQKPGQADATRALHALRARVQAISFMHELLLSPTGEIEDHLDRYIEGLVGHIVHGFAEPEVDVELDLDTRGIEPDPDALVPLALVLNELLTNAVMHGALHSDRPAIRLRVRGPSVEDASVTVEVTDSGPGFADVPDISAIGTLGLSLVDSLAHGLDGSFEIDPGPGARCRVGIPAARLQRE